MMMSPVSFAAQFEGLPLMELAVERDRLRYRVEEEKREQARGYTCVPKGIDPSPEVRLSVWEEYLSAMNEIVAAREIKEGLEVEDLPLPEGFLAACGKAYDLVGPIYMAEEMLGCWVFRTTRPLTIGCRVGVVIATGEAISFQVSELMGSPRQRARFAKHISKVVGYPWKDVLSELLDEDAHRPVYRVPDEFRNDMSNVVSEFREAMEEYRAAFGGYFPTECVGFSDAEIIRVIRECVETGREYELPDVDEHGFELIY